MVRARKDFWVIAYDISETRRRNKIVKILDKYGRRINLSVYECLFTEAQFRNTYHKISQIIDSDEDQLAYYPICINCFTKIIYQPDKKIKYESVALI